VARITWYLIAVERLKATVWFVVFEGSYVHTGRGAWSTEFARALAPPSGSDLDGAGVVAWLVQVVETDSIDHRP